MPAVAGIVHGINELVRRADVAPDTLQDVDAFGEGSDVCSRSTSSATPEPTRGLVRPTSPHTSASPASSHLLREARQPPQQLLGKAGRSHRALRGPSEGGAEASSQAAGPRGAPKGVPGALPACRLRTPRPSGKDTVLPKVNLLPALVVELQAIQTNVVGISPAGQKLELENDWRRVKEICLLLLFPPAPWNLTPKWVTNCQTRGTRAPKSRALWERSLAIPSPCKSI